MKYVPTDMPDDAAGLVLALRADQQKIRLAFVPEAITRPTFINSWTDGAAPNRVAGFYLDPTGRVQLQGSVATGVSGTAAFVLPVRFRPIAGTVVLNLRGAANNFIGIDTAGNVTVTTNVTNTALDGLSFRP